MEKYSLLFGVVGPECHVFLVLTNETDIELVREKIEKKRLQSAKKMENLVRLKKSATQSEDQRFQDQEKVRGND